MTSDKVVFSMFLHCELVAFDRNIFSTVLVSKLSKAEEPFSKARRNIDGKK